MHDVSKRKEIFANSRADDIVKYNKQQLTGYVDNNDIHNLQRLNINLFQDLGPK